jgi:hypothetical protein
VTGGDTHHCTIEEMFVSIINSIYAQNGFARKQTDREYELKERVKNVTVMYNKTLDIFQFRRRLQISAQWRRNYHFGAAAPIGAALRPLPNTH